MSLTEIEIENDFTKTCRGEQFLQVNNGENNKILIFASDRHLQYLASTRTVIMDGTFYFAPTLFTQLYVIHGEAFGRFFPLLYAFLPNKTEETYNRLFTLVKQTLTTISVNFQWQKIIIDFELAAKSAITNVFPDVIIKGCNFHFGQCLWRKIQTLGLSTVGLFFHGI